MSDKVTVIKCGGALTLDQNAICEDIATMEPGRAVLVHGGAAELDLLAGRLGVPQRRLRTPGGTSSRYTDPATLEVLVMALAGKVKPGLVAALAGYGARPVGLTGMDGRLVLARRTAAHRALLDGRTMMIRDDHNGRIRAVDASLLVTLLDAGWLPVVSPPALGLDGGPVNVDADRIAAAIAGALTAHRPVRLVLLTAAPGFLRDPADEASLLSEITLGDPAHAASAGGGMAVKLHAAADALERGVAEVVIADGRVAHPVRAALAGAGTTVRRRV